MLRFSSIHRWEDVSGVKNGLNEYIESLGPRAETWRRLKRRAMRDQDHPVEALMFVAPSPTMQPLVILGGMGPLAGAQAMLAALDKFSGSRSICLLQLCTTPDRTSAIQQDRSCEGVSPEHEAIAQSFKSGIEAGYGLLRELDPQVRPDVMISCNTAHYFAPKALALVNEANVAVYRFVSLPESVQLALKEEPAHVLALYTTGTKESGVYATYFGAGDVPFTDVSSDTQALLMQTIYDGVKAGNSDVATEQGVATLRKALAEAPNATAILAGCTEIPEILRLVADADPVLRKRLSTLRVLNPVDLALERMGLPQSS